MAGPLLRHLQLPHRGIFYPLGFPVEILTDCTDVLAAAEEVWGRFDQSHDGPPLEIRIGVTESEQRQRPAPVLPRSEEHLISFIHGPHDFVLCDLRAGFAYGSLSESIASDCAYLRYYFLEPVVYVLIGARYLTPIHGACVALGGAGVLLCGDSEAGKTTLAYACAKAGWTYVADDASHLVAGAGPACIAGRPHQIRFRTDVVRLFPELAASPALERPNGKPNVEIDTALLGIEIACRAQVSRIVFLNRMSPLAPLLTPYDKERAFESLSQSLCLGDEAIRERQRGSLRALLSHVEVYEMHYRDLSWAEQCLRLLVAGGSR